MYFEDINPSLVAITNKEGEIIGTGYWILDAGQIMTCCHLVKDRDEITIINSKQEYIPAKIKHLFPEPIWNIAILETQYSPANYLMPSSDYEVKDDILIPPLPQQTIIDKPALYGNLIPALSLRESVNDINIQGSPVILQKDDKVIGMINPKIPGRLVIPFSAMFDYLPAFKPIYQTWLDTIHKKLRHRPTEVLQKIAQFDIDVLKVKQEYSEKYFVNRRYIDSAIDRFKVNNQPMLAITGKPGLGKTYQLAAIADTNKDQINIVWLSTDIIDVKQHNIRTAIINKLSLDLQKSGEKQLHAEDLLHTMTQKPHSTIIILDGLDHLSGSEYLINKWLEQTLHWIKRINQKVIVSCSPECWRTHQNIISDIIELHPFTQGELEKAISNYGFPARYSSDKRCRHPFILHVLSYLPELLNETPLEELNLYKILEQYLDKKITTISQETGRSDFSMHVFLEEMTRYSYDTGQNYLPYNMPEFKSWSNRILIQRFINHLLLVRTNGGIRFRHKWLSIFIMSFAYKFDMVKCDWLSLSKVNDEVRQSVPWCFIRKQRYGWDILSQMEQLTDFIIQHPDHNKQAIEYLINITIFSSKPRWFFNCIIQLTSKEILSKEKIIILIERAQFTLPQQVALIKYIYIENDACELDPMLLHCINYNRKYTLKLIAAWLPDYTTQPSKNKHNLNKIACAILSGYATDNLDFVIGLLAIHIEKTAPVHLHEDQSLSTLAQIVHANFNPSLEIMDNWKTKEKHIPVIIKTANYLTANTLLNEEETISLITRIENIFSQYGLSAEDKLQCMQILKTRVRHEEDIISQVLIQLEKETFQENIYKFLAPHTDHYHKLISNATLQYILHGENEERVLECCKLFPFHKKIQIEQQHLIESLFSMNPIPFRQQYRLFTFLPFLLSNVQHGTITYGALKDRLVDGIFNHKLEPSKEVIDYICDWNDCPGKRKDNLRLMHLLCKNIDNTELHQTISFKLIDNDIYTSDEKILKIIKPALTRSIKQSNDLLDTVLSKCKINRPILHQILQEQILIPYTQH